ncbi:RTA1-domain-containing protein [Testicularia cyperi]|uniref:RTA1-domain-containing protein n=1 Tax=Testicularia cyperi TaxID=1882483 RepID=A0A317XIH4_9BASI|nr:RTA1-domain-containing protein [Testicularia cyperi]
MSKLSPKCPEVDPNPGQICSIENSPYGFEPTLWIGIVYSAIFGVLALTHLGLMAYHRWFPKFMFIAVLGACGELAGWIGRAYSAPHPFDRNAYLDQIICLILSPAFISAVNYVAFQNVMDVYGHKWSRIPRKWYVLAFVAGDICSLVVQAVGGALSAEAETETAANTGKAIMIAGVSIQVAVTAPFMALYIDYNFRRLLEWRKKGLACHERPYPRVEVFNAAIGISTLFILTRCLYRIVEMADGWKGYLATTEAYFAILDALMIVFAIGIFIPIHPGFYLPRVLEPTSSDEEKAASTADSILEKPQRRGEATATASSSLHGASLTSSTDGTRA